MRMRIVLKQYTGDTFDEIVREIRLFTLLEKEKLQLDDQKQKNMSEIFILGKQPDGLPELLGYKIQENQGEILMADAGPNLDKWVSKIPLEERMDFIVKMLN